MKVILLFTFCFSLAGCASNSAPTKPEHIGVRFDTDIRDGGLKVYSLSVRQALAYQHKTDLKKLESWMDYELEQRLTSTQFCTKDHTEIERSIGTGFAIIRGECSDLDH